MPIRQLNTIRHCSLMTILMLWFLSATPAFGDDLTGEDQLLCAASQVSSCTDDGVCDTKVPWAVNVPSFIEVDLKKKQLSTTEASYENRVTPFGNMKREGGVIYIQGIENGRAYSLVINEESGLLTVAVGWDGLSVTVFGACTPQS